jgi:hypothetical protein
MSCLVLLALAACAIGSTAGSWKPATQAAGTDIELDLQGNRVVKGELLAVEPGRFLVLEPARMVRVAFEAVRNGAAYKTGFSSQPISAETLARLRLMSRYPQGVPSELEQQLLAAYGFAAVVEER